MAVPNTIDNPATKWRYVGMGQAFEERRKRITARVSDKVSAYKEAQRVIERESVIRLSRRGERKVLSLLDDPPKPNKHLKNAVKMFKGTVRA